MTFTEAYELLKDNKYITRAAWEANGDYCMLAPKMPCIWKILFHPTLSAGNWGPSLEDLEATDWQEIFAKVEADIVVPAIEDVQVEAQVV